jgi:phenylacetate-CoA ligase
MDAADKMMAWAVRHVLFPWQERYKGHKTMQMLRQMEAQQWLSPDEIRQLQQRRLRQFIRHAFTTDHYREIFQALQLSPEQITSASDLPKLPILTKENIRENLERMRSSDGGRVRRFSTGGSTGEPLTFYLGATRVSSDVAARMRAENWWGVSIGDREVVIWGSPLETSKQDRLRDVRDRIMRTRLLSAFEMSAPTMSHYLDQITTLRPRRIFGYPSSIALLCGQAQREKRDLRTLGVRAVFVTGEYLWDHWRRSISETFGCAVANGYGGRDSGFIAHECPSGGMHLNADRMIVEIVDGEGRPLPPGEPGEIVVTHLDTPEMPFIRYATGDIGSISAQQCVCGRGLPLLDRVEGRKTDFVVTPDGRVMHGLSLIYILREIDGIERFRIIQRGLHEFEVEIVRSRGYDPACEGAIRETFCRRLRAQVAVRIRYVRKIATGPSGKYRYVVCELSAHDAAACGWQRDLSSSEVAHSVGIGPLSEK